MGNQQLKFLICIVSPPTQTHYFFLSHTECLLFPIIPHSIRIQSINGLPLGGERCTFSTRDGSRWLGLRWLGFRGGVLEMVRVPGRMGLSSGDVVKARNERKRGK